MTPLVALAVIAALAALGVYVSWRAGRLDRLHARVETARAALDAALVRRSSVALELASSGLLDPAASLLLADLAHDARSAGPAGGSSSLAASVPGQEGPSPQARAAESSPAPSAQASVAGGQGGPFVQVSTAEQPGGSSVQATTAGEQGESSRLANIAEGPDGSSPLADTAKAFGVSALPASTGGRELAESDLTRALRAIFSQPEFRASLERTERSGELLAELETTAHQVFLARTFYNNAVAATLAARRRWLARTLRLAGGAPLPDFFEIDDALVAPGMEDQGTDMPHLSGN